MMTARAEALLHGMEWVECEECHGNGSIPSFDHTGQAWCMGCHGYGGRAVHPSKKVAPRPPEVSDE